MIKRTYLLITYSILQSSTLLITPHVPATRANHTTKSDVPTLSPHNAIPANNTILTPTPPITAPIVTAPPMPPSPFIPAPVSQQRYRTLQAALRRNPKLPIEPKTPNGYHYDNMILMPIAWTALVATFLTKWANTPTPQSICSISSRAPQPHLPPPIKRKIDQIVAQQYTQLETIATAYEQALRDNQRYHSGQYRSRIQRRIDAIKQWQLNPDKKTIIHTHEWFSTVQHTFLDYSRFAHSAYTTITADPVQCALHKEITAIAHILADFHAQLAPAQQGSLFNHALLLMELARSYNGSNSIVQAMNAADVCWEIIEAAHTLGPSILFSQKTEQIWYQLVLYSHAELPECSIDWDQFEQEKHQWSMQKQCQQILDGCGVFIKNSITAVEQSAATVRSALTQVVTVLYHFLLHDVFIKIDMFATLLFENATSIARKCKEKLISMMRSGKALLREIAHQLYACIPSGNFRKYIQHAGEQGVSFITDITINAIALYLLAGLFSPTSEAINVKTAGLMSLVLRFIHNGSLGATLAQTLLKAAHTYPVQMVIIGAALLTPLVSPLLEKYHLGNQERATLD